MALKMPATMAEASDPQFMLSVALALLTVLLVSYLWARNRTQPGPPSTSSSDSPGSPMKESVEQPGSVPVDVPSQPSPSNEGEAALFFQPPAPTETTAAPETQEDATADDIGDGQFQQTARVLAAKHGVDVGTALRFSLARKGDVAKAGAMLAADLKWRAATQPAAVKQEEVMRALPSGCWRVAGLTSSGKPVLVIHLSMWNPEAYDVDEYGRYVCYFVEKMLRMGERFVVIFDMKGWKLSHALHMSKIQKSVTTVQDHYPERLEKALLMRAPLIFSAPWTVIKGFLDPRTAVKVAFVAKSPEAEARALEECGARKCMPKGYGGEREELIDVPNLPGEPNVPGAPAIR